MTRHRGHVGTEKRLPRERSDLLEAAREGGKSGSEVGPPPTRSRLIRVATARVKRKREQVGTYVRGRPPP